MQSLTKLINLKLFVPLRSCRKFCHAAGKNLVSFDNLKHFGLLSVKCPNANIIVKNVDPHVHQNGDRAIIKCNTTDDRFEIRKYFEWYYDVNLSKLLLNQISKLENNDVLFEIEIPHNFDIDVCGKDVSIIETEGKNVKVDANGNCDMGKIKSFETSFNVKGKLICKTLQGNGICNVDQIIKIGKLQTFDFVLHSEKSNIEISDIYSKYFKCSTVNGDIKISSLHGKGVLHSKNGNIKIDSISGDFDISTDSGNVDLVFDKFQNSDIRSNNGDINIGFSESVSTSIIASGLHIDIPETLLFDGLKQSVNDRQYFEGKLGDGVSDISVQSDNGTISLSKKDWISKFNIDLD